MMGYINDWGIGFGFGWLFMIVFWALIIWVVLVLTKSVSGRGYGHRRHHEKTALDILKERYAKGEINKAEFEEKKKRKKI